MRYDGELKLKTRDEIISEATQVLRVSGPDRLGVAEVMSRVGLSHGRFYDHFQSKDELIAAAIERAFEEQFKKAIAPLLGQDPTAALTALIERYLSARHTDAFAHGCPMASLVGEVPRMSPAAQEAFVRGTDSIVEAIAEQLELMGRQDARQLARSALAEMLGSLVLSRILPDREHALQLLAATQISVKLRLGIAE